MCMAFGLSLTGCTSGDKNELTIASYNVQCLSYGTQLEQISEEIKNISPVIIGIQELDNNTRRTNNTNQLEQLAQAADYKYFYFSKTYRNNLCRNQPCFYFYRTALRE